MTPLYLRLAVPLIELLAAIVIMRRMSWKAHPALIGYLISEFLTRILSLPNYNLVLAFTLIRIVARTAVVFEVLKFARVPVPPEVRGPAVGMALAASAFAAGATRGLSVGQQTALFNQYYHLLLCVALLSIAVRRWIMPKLECRRHRVYRVGMAAWLAVVAWASCFVRGGVAYLLVPYKAETWHRADYTTCVALIIVVSTMAGAMVRSMPKRKTPAKVQTSVKSQRVVDIRRVAA